MKSAFLRLVAVLAVVVTGSAAETHRIRRFAAQSPADAMSWQKESRAILFRLMTGGSQPKAVPLVPAVLRCEGEDDPAHPWVLEELTLQALPDRRVHAWMAVPKKRTGKVGAILALHGHGGSGEQVIRGQGLYWYGRAFTDLGCVVIAPDIGSHRLQHTNWSLMGERVWDALRCLDYLETRAEVDARRMMVAGLSLGGEATMYVAALDERIRAACSSGWLTTVENMKQGHCPCWNYPGLETHFDFADIFACVAPRPLVMEIGQLERAPGGFPVAIAQSAFAEIAAAYRVFGAEKQGQLVIHPGGHVFEGTRFWQVALEGLGGPSNPSRSDDSRPSEIALPKAMSADVQFLSATARTLLGGCRVRAADGTVLYTPDGRGNYRALWTRDFAYMVENAGDLLPADHVEACLHYLLKGIRADGAAPDRVRPDGVAVYAAGGEDHPLGEPNIDNAQFLVIAVDEHLKRVPASSRFPLFRQWSGPLDRAMDYIPRTKAGLVFNDPQKPHSPYGFTDTVAKTGELFFESLLYWTACRRLAYWHDRYGGFDRSRLYQQRASLIATNAILLWDATTNAFLAASGDCRQIDVWGNAYALWIDFPLGPRRARVLEFLARNRDRYLWRGQVRHLLTGQHWQRLLTPVEPERYQNGAYWATASGWMMWALAQYDLALARIQWQELLADFRQAGVFECVSPDHRQLESYVVSAANPLGAARRLGAVLQGE